MDWSHFFAPGTRVMALPNWRSPRLYVPAHPALLRWRGAGFYSGWRFSARIWRTFLRAKAVACPGKTHLADSSKWVLGEFISDVFPQAEAAAVQSNPRNFSGKLVAQLRSRRGDVVGYVKCGERSAARERLHNEYTVLKAIPPNMGPSPLKFGEFADGVALCLSPVKGKTLPLSLRPPTAVVEFANSLPSSSDTALEDHPWVKGIRKQGNEELDRHLEPLVAMRWPVVVQHGDFAPWNMVATRDGSVRAFDWEYGCLEGFAHLDIAYYLVQVGLLVRRYSPSKAVRHAVDYLTTSNDGRRLEPAAARSMVALAAYEQYSKSARDGHGPNTPLQQARLSIWRNLP